MIYPMVPFSVILSDR